MFHGSELAVECQCQTRPLAAQVCETNCRSQEDRPMSRQSGARGFPTPDGNLRAAIRYLEKSVQAAPCENPERGIGTYIHNDSHRCLDRATGRMRYQW